MTLQSHEATAPEIVLQDHGPVKLATLGLAADSSIRRIVAKHYEGPEMLSAYCYLLVIYSQHGAKHLHELSKDKEKLDDAANLIGLQLDPEAEKALLEYAAAIIETTHEGGKI